MRWYFFDTSHHVLLHGLLLLLVVMILVVVLVGRVLVGMLLLMLLRGKMLLLLLLHVRRPVERVVMVMVHLLLLRRRRGHRRGRTRRRRGSGGELKVGEDAPACRAHAQGVPVDPSKPILKKVIKNSIPRKSLISPSPGGQIRRVPLLAALVPDLPPETPLHVGQRLHPAVARLQDLPQQRDVGDGQPQSVDLAQPLLVGEGGHVQAELLEGRVDAAGAEVGRGEGAVMLIVKLNFLKIICVFLTSLLSSSPWRRRKTCL